LAWGVALAFCFWWLSVAQTWYHRLYGGLALVLLSLVVLAALDSRRDPQHDHGRESAITMLTNAVLAFSAAVGGNAIFSGLSSRR